MRRVMHFLCLLGFMAAILTSWMGEAAACVSEAAHQGGVSHHAAQADDQVSAPDIPAKNGSADHNCPDGCHHHAHSMMKPVYHSASLPQPAKEIGFWPQHSGQAQHSPSLNKPPIK